MKLVKHAFILAILAAAGVAQANSDIFYTVPFHNAEVKAASKIYVDYNYNSHNQTLVCTSKQEDDAITSVEWIYKDATRKIDLPVTLQDNPRFKGYLSDPQGRLIITNDFVSSESDGSILVSCEYRNMK